MSGHTTNDADGDREALPDGAQQVVKHARINLQATGELSRAIGGLNFPDEFVTAASGYESAGYIDLEPLSKLYIYQQVAGFSQRQVVEKLEENDTFRIRFGLDRPITQGTISYFRRDRISRQDRQTLEAVAAEIRELAEEDGALEDQADTVQPSPDEVDTDDVSAAQLRSIVQKARDDLLSEFNSGRASNAKYDDDTFWEMAALLSVLPAGTQEGADSYSDVYPGRETPDADTLERTIKKTGEPDDTAPIAEAATKHGDEEWCRIHNHLASPLNRAIGHILDEYDLGDQIRQPVDVAIDITTWRFYPPPGEERVNGIPVEEFPEMVSGTYKKSHVQKGSRNAAKQDESGKPVRAYKFATLTIVGRDTPLTVALEPVKQESWWQDDEEVTTTPYHEVVDRLLTQAEQHIDINRVFADRGLSNYKTRAVIDQHDATYVLPMRQQSEPEEDFLEMIQDRVSRTAVEKDDVLYMDCRYDEYAVYVPAQSDNREYIEFRTNARDVDADRGSALVNLYSDRWQIESEYNTIKKEFLPDAVSKDYRMRLFYFILAVMMCNLWRLTNLLMRRDTEADLGESPPVTTGRVKLHVLALSFKQRGIG